MRCLARAVACCNRTRLCWAARIPGRLPFCLLWSNLRAANQPNRRNPRARTLRGGSATARPARSTNHLEASARPLPDGARSHGPRRRLGAVGMGDGLRAHGVPVCVRREPAKARRRAVGGPDAGLHGMRLLVRSPRAPRLSVLAAAPKTSRLRGRPPTRRYRASTDLCGLRSFYAVWLLAYASQCASCVSWCLWCDTELAWHSTRAPMLVCCGLTTLVGLVIAGGCVACALAVAAPGSACLLYTSPSPRDLSTSRMPSSA